VPLWRNVGLRPLRHHRLATIASVVIMSPATDAASRSRTTSAGVDDAVGEHIEILLDLGVEAVGLGLVLKDVADDGWRVPL